MHRLPIFLLLACTFWTSLGRAEEPASAPTAAAENSQPAAANTPPGPENVPLSGNAAFAQGLESFKRNDFARSRTHFNQLLAEHPQDPTLLYNLGLVEASDKHPGRALAYWRKALYISPGFSPVLAGLSHLKKSKQLPADAEVGPLTWLYWRIPLSWLLSISLICFVAAGFLWIRGASEQKAGRKSNLAIPLSMVSLFFLFLGLSVHDYMLFHFEPKATIMEPTVAAYSSPSSEAPSLFDFREGDEVSIRRTQDDWLQVQKSATSVGWVKKNQILIHTGG